LWLLVVVVQLLYIVPGGFFLERKILSAAKLPAAQKGVDKSEETFEKMADAIGLPDYCCR